MSDSFTVLQLVLSLLTLVLAILVWHKHESSQEPESRTTENPSDDLQRITRGLDKASLQFNELMQNLPKPTESVETQFVSAFLVAYERWTELARKQEISAAFAKEVRMTTDNIRALLRQLQATPGGKLGNKYWAQIDQILIDATWEAVSCMDRDIDRSRNKREIQSALINLVHRANLELIDPKPGSRYLPEEKSAAILVGEVRTRGLRIQDGDILHEPEILESR
jgi:hypothetical protein